jgi:hypothetical protein
VIPIGLWKYVGIIAVILGLGLWIESLRVTVARQQLTIQQYQSATALAKAEVEATRAADAKTAKEISDANDEQVRESSSAITALLLHKPAAGVPAPAAHPTAAPAIADAGTGGQPSGGNPPSPDCAVVPARSDAAEVLGVAILGWEQVKAWRQWQRETAATPMMPSR